MGGHLKTVHDLIATTASRIRLRMVDASIYGEPIDLSSDDDVAVAAYGLGYNDGLERTNKLMSDDDWHLRWKREREVPHNIRPSISGIDGSLIVLLVSIGGMLIVLYLSIVNR